MFMYAREWGSKHQNTHQQWLRDQKTLTHNNTNCECDVPKCNLKPEAVGGIHNINQPWWASTTECWAVGSAGCPGHLQTLTWGLFPWWHMMTLTGNPGIQFWPPLFESAERELIRDYYPFFLFFLIPFPFFSSLNQQAWPIRLPNSTGLLFLFFLCPSGSHQCLKLCRGGSPVWQVICSAAGNFWPFATNGPDSEAGRADSDRQD